MDQWQKEINDKIDKYIPETNRMSKIYKEILKKDELELEEIIIIFTLDELLAQEQKICEYMEDVDGQIDEILQERKFLIEYGCYRGQEYLMDDKNYKQITFFEMLLSRAEKIQEEAANDLRFKFAADMRDITHEIENKIPGKFEDEYSSQEDQMTNSYTLERLRRMDASKFEELVSHLWEINGWETKLTSYSSDKGIDVTATKEDIFDKRRHLIQAKRYNENNKIGSETVQKYSGLYQRNEQVDKVFIVTTGYFTKDAKKVAANREVQLLNGEEIKNMLNEQSFDQSEGPVF